MGDKGLTRAFAIFDENDQQGIVKQVMRRMGLDTKQLTPRTVLGRISWAKNHMVDPQEYYLGSKDPNSERIAHIFKGYQAELRKNNALDFDDLLLEAVRLLNPRARCAPSVSGGSDICSSMSTRTPTGRSTSDELLAGENKNVCAVGDEDQSIYSWRGADIGNILEFEKDFPNAQDPPAGAELPFDAKDSGRGGRGGGQQHSSQGQEAVDRAAGRIVDRILRSAGRRKRSAVHRRPDSDLSAGGQESGEPTKTRIAPCFIAPTRSRGW